MANILKFAYISGLLFFFVSKSYAQNLESLKTKNAVVVNGFISTNQVYNNYSSESSPVNTYTGFYTGNINFNIYGVNVPFTFVYSSGKSNVTLPFNQFGLHPSYKWVQTHIGYASMSFSPYSLNGHLFYGAGVELTPPGVFRISAMCGRLRKAVPYDSLGQRIAPSYNRIGYGIKVGLAKEKDYVDLIVFKAGDRPGTIKGLPDTLTFQPEENTVVSVCFGKYLFNKVSVTAEYATSAYTKSKNSVDDGANQSVTIPAAIFSNDHAVTTYHKAFKANLSYSISKLTAGIGFERIDPEYNTMGAYYFTNNLQNITLNFSTNMFDNKLTVAGNTGIQKDNIDKSRMNQTNRFVSSINTGIIPSEKLDANLSYSNFLSYTNVRSTFDYINQTTPYENWDTLNFRQISQNINVNTNYRISSSKEYRHIISFNSNVQASNDISGADSCERSNFYNVSTSYVFSIVPSSINLTATINFNRNHMSQANTSTIGPSIGASKMFLDKKLRAIFNLGYNTSYTNNVKSGNVINFRFGGVYVIKQKHNLNLSFLYQLRKQILADDTMRNYNTTTITFGYVYNFSLFNPKTKQSAVEPEKL